MMATSTQECFVCLETTGTRFKVCDCNTAVHAECLMKLVDQVASHKRQCAVCKQPYTCISWRRRTKCVVLPGTAFFVALHVLVWSMGVSYVWLSIYVSRGWYTALLALMLLASFMTLCFLHRLHELQVGTCCCAYVDCTASTPELRV